MDYNGLSCGAIGPDGHLYMYPWYSRQFIAYEPKERKFEEMGDYLPAKGHAPGETRHGVYGCDFDTQGVLWYAVFSRNCGSGRREIGMPSSLFRWDIARGGKPEWMGVIGTKERAACWTSEVRINDDDIMHIIGSNHAVDGPDITAVDLKKYRGEMHNLSGQVTEDPYYSENPPERYQKVADFFLEDSQFQKRNAWKLGYPIRYKPVRLWRALAPDHIEDSPVKRIYWEDAETLKGVCGTETDYVFTVAGGKLTHIAPASERPAGYNGSEAAEEEFEDKAELPYYPGRQYKAVPVAQAKLGNKRVVGTQDGMLAVCGGEGVFALGPAAYNGPVRCLASTPDCSAVYGVAGDIDDIGIVFRYDEKQGLRWLGHVSSDAPYMDGAVHCNVLSSCAVSPDGKTLAVGSGDRLGTLMFYQLS
jgi:hypothetical protein